MSTTTGLVIAVVVLAVLLVAGWAVQTANRLDRLNVRVDLARGSLYAALERRTVVARTMAGILAGSTDPELVAAAADLVRVAHQAEQAPSGQREAAENAVSAALARVDAGHRPPTLVIELTDAETRVMMARRFYNDAVRDTRGLAERRAVRWLRLAGNAAPPNYFEIVERISHGSTH